MLTVNSYMVITFCHIIHQDNFLYINSSNHCAIDKILSKAVFVLQVHHSQVTVNLFFVS